MRADLKHSRAEAFVRLGILSALALMVAFVSPEVMAQKKAKGKKGKKAEAAQAEPAPAPPEDPAQAEARTRYAAGKTAFEKGDFAQALVEFQAAYDAKPHPTVLKSIAECQVETGDIVNAIATLERFLEDPAATGKKEVEQRLEAIKAMLATLEVTSEPSGASISLDGRPTGLTTPASIQIGPGPHTLTFDLTGYETFIRDVSVTKGDMALVAVKLIATAPTEPPGGLLPYDDNPPPAPETQTDNGPPPAFWACAALTGLGLIGGAVFGTMALNDEDKWKETEGTQEEVRESGERNAIIADVSFGVAAVAALTGSIILIASGKKKGEQPSDKASASVSVVPTTGKNAVGLSASVEF